MPRIEMARLALASEKPDTCTGLPRLTSPQGAEQDARMNAFVPPEYLSFDDAIDRVAEITMLARESTSPAAHKDTDSEPPRPGIAKGIWTKEAAMIERRLLGKEELQKLLYTEQIPSVVIEENGSCHPAPGYIWGGKQWHEALWYNRITFPYGRDSYLSGRPIIPKDALEAAFNADGTPRSTVEASSAQEASMPRHQYRTHLLGILDELWSEIDATNWQENPPKKAAIVADCKGRFELSDREAAAIATLFTPDIRRGKAKKG